MTVIVAITATQGVLVGIEPKEPVMRWTFLIILFLTLSILAQTVDFKVRYVSSDAVYIDGGRENGLQVNDTLQVTSASGEAVILVVKYVADKTASCIITNPGVPIKQGDKATLTSLHPQKLENREIIPKLEERKPVQRQSQYTSRRRSKKSVYGSIAIQQYNWDDQSKSNFDFSQPTLRLNLSGRSLGGRFIDLQIKTRARYDRRSAKYETVPQKEWRNRIYQCYLDYNNPRALLNIKIGRIISNPLSGIGYLDGLMTQFNFSQSFNLGAMAGLAPEWQYADLQTSIHKYGVFARFKMEQPEKHHFESTLAFAGEYHKSIISREFAYWQNQYDWHKRLWLFTSVELDINRDWRKTRSQESITPSNLYLNGTYEAFNWLSAGLSIDRRKNFWTYEYRTMADSLFNDVARQGARGQLNFRIPGGHLLGTTFGLTRRTTDSQPTYSYTISYNHNNFARQHLLINLYASGFSSPFYQGISTNFSLGRNLTRFFYLYARLGRAAYQINNGAKRQNNQYQINGNLGIGRHIYTNFFYEYDQGDDEKGLRSWIELGYRF